MTGVRTSADTTPERDIHDPDYWLGQPDVQEAHAVAAGSVVFIPNVFSGGSATSISNIFIGGSTASIQDIFGRPTEHPHGTPIIPNWINPSDPAYNLEQSRFQFFRYDTSNLPTVVVSNAGRILSRALDVCSTLSTSPNPITQEARGTARLDTALETKVPPGMVRKLMDAVSTYLRTEDGESFAQRIIDIGECNPSRIFIALADMLAKKQLPSPLLEGLFLALAQAEHAQALFGARKFLIDLAQSAQPSTRYAAIQALGQFGREEDLAFLRSLISVEKVRSIRELLRSFLR